MGNSLFQLNIITSEKTLYQGEICSLIAPSELGAIGVLAHHAPLVANLVPGKIIIKDTNNYAITFKSSSKGILEVLNNTATIIIDTLET